MSTILNTPTFYCRTCRRRCPEQHFRERPTHIAATPAQAAQRPLDKMRAEGLGEVKCHVCGHKKPVAHFLASPDHNLTWKEANQRREALQGQTTPPTPRPAPRPVPVPQDSDTQNTWDDDWDGEDFEDAAFEDGESEIAEEIPAWVVPAVLGGFVGLCILFGVLAVRNTPRPGSVPGMNGASSSNIHNDTSGYSQNLSVR